MIIGGNAPNALFAKRESNEESERGLKVGRVNMERTEAVRWFDLSLLLRASSEVSSLQVRGGVWPRARVDAAINNSSKSGVNSGSRQQ
jgi:hypothetical protein